MISVDFIIVGQGIAGTNLAFHLLRNHHTIHVFDDQPDSTNASSVAAGIINPITGRKFVKSWMIESLLPEALSTYQKMESLLQTPLLSHIPVLRTLASNGEYSDWEGRLANPSYLPFMAEKSNIGNTAQFLSPPIGYGQVLQSARIDTTQLIASFKKFLQLHQRISIAPFQYDQVQVHSNFVTYQNYKAKHLIFAEGAGIQNNPFFPKDLIRPNKGQVLIIQTPNSPSTLNRIVKQALFFVPLKNLTYWVGSTTENSFTIQEPTQEGKERLIDKLQKVFLPDYQIVQHLSGLRATVKDRRPAIGTHTDYPIIHLFNGMGTKGASLAPFWSQHLINHILKGQPLDSSVNFQRFL